VAAMKTALELVEGALVEAQQSQTLINALNFESPEHEYLFEKERNSANKKLLDTILKRLTQTSGQQSRIRLMESLILRSDELRAEAELEAKKGDYPRAIRSMELATRTLIQAQRVAGFTM